MNKSDIVETFRERISKQPNPWQPYTGPAGGQGWVNVITGEKRYQENRPDPGEGMPEDHEGDVPQPDVDVEGFTPTEVTAEDYQEFLEPGMEVEGEVDAGVWSGGEVQAVGENSVVIEDEVSGEPQEIAYEHLTEHPVEFQPWDGYGEGWAEAPEEFTDLDTDQTVEVYNLETGQYMEGRVQMIEEDDPAFEGDYISIVTEEEGTIEIAPGIETGEEYMITAAEDMEFTEGVPAEFEEVGLDDLEDLDDGDAVMVEVDDASFPDEPQEGVYDEEEHAIEVTTPEASFYVNPDYHADKITGMWAQPPEMVAATEVPGLDLDDPDTYWPMLTGGLASVSVPGQGDAEGEVGHVKTDDEGHGWFGIEAEPDPSAGDTFTVGDTEWFIHDIWSEAGEDYASVESDEDDEIRQWMLEDVEERFDPETVMVTTNPDSPLYVGESLSEVEAPFVEPTGDEQFKIGDRVVIDGEVHEVDGGIMDQDMVILDDQTEFTHEELREAADAVHLHESKDPPSKSPDEEWVSPVKYEEEAGVTIKPIKEGSHIYYHDAETGEMKIGEAAEFTQDNDIELSTGETIHRADVTGFARDERTNVVEPSHLNTGDEITVKVGDDEISGPVVDVSTIGGTSVEILTDDGIESIKPGRHNVAISEHSDEAETFKPSAWEYDEDGNIIDEVPTDDIVSDIEERVDFTHRDSENRLEKDYPVLKEEKRRLRAEMYREFGAETVDNYYEMKQAWKGNSASHPDAERLERAYKQAFDLNAPHRDNGGRAPDRETVKMAEAIGKLSQNYFRETMGEEAELARGSSGQAWGSFVEQFLSDPNQEEYRLEFLANNNHTTDFRSTADKWNAFTAQHVVEADSVLSMTDHLFEASHENELEIGVHGDGQTVTLDGIRPGNQGYDTRTRGLNSNIETWDSQQVSKFWESMSLASDKIHYDDFGTGQLENLRRLVERHDERVTTTSNEVERARGVLVENGMPPEGSDITDEFSYSDLEGIGDVTEFEWGEGVEASFTTEFGDTYEGEIMGLDDDGDIVAWAMTDPTQDLPDEFYLEEDDIHDLDIDRLDELQTQAALPDGSELMDLYSIDIDDLGELDDVYYTHGGDLKEGTVLDVTGDGTVEISGEMGQTEYFDRVDVENGMVAPADKVEADALGVPEGPDIPSHDETELVMSNPGLYDLDEGDLVSDGLEVYEIEETPTTSTGEYTVIDNQGDTHTLQDWEMDEKVEPKDDGSDDPLDAPSFGEQGVTPDDGTDVVYDADVGNIGGHVQYTSDDGSWVYVEDDAGNVYTADPDNVYPDEPEGSDVSIDPADVDPVDLYDAYSTGEEIWIEHPSGEYVELEGVSGDGFYYTDPDTGDSSVVGEHTAAANTVSVGEPPEEPDGSDEYGFDEGEFITTEGPDGNEMEWEVSTDADGETVLYHPDSDTMHDADNVLDDHEVVDDAGGSADTIDDQNDVDPGDQVMVPHYDDPGPWEVESLIQDPDHGYTGIQLENGDALDFGEIMPPDEEDEGGFDAEEALEDLGIGGEDYIAPEDAALADLGVGEEFETEIHGEPATVEVVEVSADPMYPVEVEDSFGDRWLLWDDGNVEEV